MMVAVADGAVDFFVSYTSADRPWAEWIAWELEHAGHSVIVQAWDMQPGSNFVLEMDDAARWPSGRWRCCRQHFSSPRIAVRNGRPRSRGPRGRAAQAGTGRVRECEPDGLLGSVVFVDVVALDRGRRRALRCWRV